jgi:hypothetical protein
MTKELEMLIRAEITEVNKQLAGDSNRHHVAVLTARGLALQWVLLKAGLAL